MANRYGYGEDVLGITPPGGSQGAPGSLVPGWSPDLRDSEDRATAAILVKF